MVIARELALNAPGRAASFLKLVSAGPLASGQRG